LGHPDPGEEAGGGLNGRGEAPGPPYKQGEFRRTGVDDLMGRPYGRIVLLHVTLIIGGAVLQALGSPIAGLCLFLVLKIGFDLRAHLRERVLAKTGGETN